VVLLTHYRNRVACLSVLLTALQAAAFAQSASEYEIKAAFLYKFAGFVQWPEDAGSSSDCVGVLGKDPFGAILDETARGKTMNNRPLPLLRLRPGQDPQVCRILFISSSERQRIRLIVNRLPPGILTVGDMPGFCESGGIIGFEVLDRRVHLRINLEAAQRARLQLSSKLLSLAKLVGGGTQ
jgi:hypothetical protein